MIAEKGLLSAFRRQEDPKELVRKWQRQIRTEIRGVERQMLGAMGAGPALAAAGRCWGCKVEERVLGAGRAACC